jgi:hypothetical protein
VNRLTNEDRIKIDESESQTIGTNSNPDTAGHRYTMPRQNRPSLGFGLIDEKSLTESMIITQENYINSKTDSSVGFKPNRDYSSPRASRKMNSQFLPSL